MSDAKVFHLDRFASAWTQLVEAKKRAAEAKKFADEAGDLFKQLANGASEFRLNGHRVADIVAGQLNKTLLAKEQPDLVAKYTRQVTKAEFDKEAFAREEPELFKQYQAQRLVLFGETFE